MSPLLLTEAFLEMVRGEFERSNENNNSNFASSHEAYAVIKEELDEFWQEVKKKSSERNTQRMVSELVQIAAMCLKAAHSPIFPKDNPS